MDTTLTTAMMLVSREKNRYTPINADKVHRGSFLTVHAGWLLPHIAQFIRDAHAKIAVDPFAGDWDMLRHVQDVINIEQLAGYDIAPCERSTRNDSLVHIPSIANAIAITNPTYLANHSAKRKGVWHSVRHYFTASRRTDLYQIALDRCLESYPHVVAIVPETFIGSGYPIHRLRHVTIIEGELFSDTDCPVCVVCFEPEETPRSTKVVYRNEKRVCTFSDIDRINPTPHHSIRLTFNDPNGPIALRAVDLTDPTKPIQFLLRNDIDYAQKNIKQSSRLITFISSPDIPQHRVAHLVHRANEILHTYRTQYDGVHLSPFKGNTRDGRRRRRLDYHAARALLEQAAGDLGLCARAQRLLL